LRPRGTTSGVMKPSPQSPSKGPPSFTSNASLPPSYQSNNSSIHSSAQGRSLGTSSPDNVSDISFGSEAALPGPRYVYYRVYSPAGGVEVKNPEFPEDPYLGRTLAIRITPPHLAASVKRHICGREDITDYDNTSLFTDILCLTPLDDSEAVHILDRAGTGSTPGDPVALVSSKLGASERTHVPNGAGYQYTLKANRDSYASASGLLAFKKGDILHTDGVPIKDPYHKTYDGFDATNYATQASGFVALDHVEFVGPSPTLPPKWFEPLIADGTWNS